MGKGARAAAGALELGISGASLGSAFGPIGTGIGAGAGVLAGGLKGLFSRTPEQKARARAKKLEKRQRRLAKKQARTAKMNGTPAGPTGTTTTPSADPGNLYNTPTEPEGNMFTGYEPHLQQFSPYTATQQASQNQLIPGLTQQLSQNTGSFDPYAERARRDFEMYSQPALQAQFERFGATGGGNAQSALSKARGEFESNLGVGRADYEQKQRGQQIDLYKSLMNPALQNHFTGGTGGVLGDIAQNGIQGGIESLSEAAKDYWKNNSTSKEEPTGSSGNYRQRLAQLQGNSPARPLTPDEQILNQTQKNRLGGTPRRQPNYVGGANYNRQPNYVGGANLNSQRNFRSISKPKNKPLTPDERILRKAQTDNLLRKARGG